MLVSFINFRRVFIRLFFLGLFLFAGCGKKRRDPGSQAGMTNNFELLAAKHSDLPVPVGFKLKFATETCHPELVSGSRNTNSNYFIYKGKSSLENIIKFYNQALELAGWQVNNFSNNLECLFVCNKPNEHMVLSVRPAAGKIVANGAVGLPARHSSQERRLCHPELDSGSSNKKSTNKKIKLYFFIKHQNIFESKNLDLINSKQI
ncbi:MAG: hypothetical protein SZ59_C0004G0012 [candidate division TM6 bacterium GW2011_GWF2_28_16]|nr:MAG: hypothetical protein SZ59_C0004G0012 [candidate division TM6 bacterium GW2011_GWF2_28_16]